MPIKMTCLWCENNFEITPSRFSNSNGKFFCSKSCFNKYLSANKKLNETCPVCGKKFYLKKSAKDKMKWDKPCCSVKCASVIRKTSFLGDKNHQFGLKGEMNSSYISDIDINAFGYYEIRNTTHPFRIKGDKILLHRAIMEEWLRITNPESEYLVEVDGENALFLDPNIHVHHINEIKTDNRIDNLMLLTPGEHSRLHNEGQNYPRDEDGRFVKRGKYKKEINNSFTTMFKKNTRDAGLDVCSTEDVILKGRSSELVKTGIRLEIPVGHVGLLWSRSGLSVKNKIEVGAGCIDSEYRGEVLVHLYNFSDNDYQIKAGDRIAQLLTLPVNLDYYEETDDELSVSERNKDGFGSTGN